MSNGDPYKKVQPGQRFSFPAQTYNDMIDAILASKRGGVIGTPRTNRRELDNGLIKVKNTSESNVHWYGILGVDDILFTPEQNLSGFRNQPVLKCVAPAAGTHEGKFLILQTPVAAGKIGVAMALGVTPVQIDVTDENHTHADIKAGDVTQLKSAPSGAAQILWKETGTGTKWAVVRLGGEKKYFYATLSDEDDGSYSWIQVHVDGAAFTGALIGVKNTATAAEEINGAVGIEIGTIVKLYIETDSTGAIVYRFDKDLAVPCGDFYKIKSESSGVFTANRVYPDHTTGDFVEYDPAQTITTLKESNGLTGVPVNTIVWVHFIKDDEGDWKYRFFWKKDGCFGKALSADHPASVADDPLGKTYIDVNPCDYDGTNTDEETTVRCYKASAWSDETDCEDTTVNVGDVIAYIPFDDNKGILFPLRPRARLLSTVSHWDTRSQKPEVGDLIYASGVTGTVLWQRFAKGTRGSILKMTAVAPSWKEKGADQSLLYSGTDDIAWLAKGSNGAVLTVNSSGNLAWLSPPAGPAVLCYDATSGVHWLALSGAYHGAFRSASSTMESTPQKATS